LPKGLTAADAGEAHEVQADGKLYVWSGSRWPADGAGSDFRGPKGDVGAAGGAADVAVVTHAAVAKSVPVDADEFPVLDSVSTPVAFALRKLSWANLKAALLAWFGPVTATLTNKTLTSPRINEILDSSGNVAVGITATPSAVNHLSFVNRATGFAPRFAAVGPDADINIACQPKGKGGLTLTTTVSGFAPTIQAYGPDNNHSLDLKSQGLTGKVLANGDPVVTTTAAQSLSNKTLVSPTLSGSPVVNGASLGGRVAVPATATTAAKPGDWAADATWHYSYTGNGTVHTWVRSAAAAW
jgi:hypothetical protein